MGPRASLAEGCCCAVGGGGTASCPCRGTGALGEVCSRLLCHTQRKRRPQRGWVQGWVWGWQGGQLPPKKQRGP